MSEQGYNEYEQYAPATSGRLFSNAMFGFSKEEVLEYLDEVAYENEQRQEAADIQIQELSQQIRQLEEAATLQPPPADSAELEALRQQAAQLGQQLEIAQAATQQSEAELAEVREQMFTAQQENNWLREEYKKADERLEAMRQQQETAGDEPGGAQAAPGQLEELQAGMDELTLQLNASERQAEEKQQALEQAERRLNEGGGPDLAEKERTIQSLMSEKGLLERQLTELQAGTGELRRQLNEARAEADRQRSDAPVPSTGAAAAIIADANAEADRIRAVAMDEKERIRRQIRSSAGGLSESITNLRGDVSSVEGNVTQVLEHVQTALADIVNALSRTEQNLSTLGVQVERFPAPSASVAPPQPPPAQQVVYFQPSGQQPAPAPGTRRRPTRAQPDSYGPGGFRRVGSELSEAPRQQPFKPTYTTSPGAWPQMAEAQPEEDLRDERLRGLAENLVDTLVQMLE